MSMRSCVCRCCSACSLRYRPVPAPWRRRRRRPMTSSRLRPRPRLPPPARASASPEAWPSLAGMHRAPGSATAWSACCSGPSLRPAATGASTIFAIRRRRRPGRYRRPVAGRILGRRPARLGGATLATVSLLTVGAVGQVHRGELLPGVAREMYRARRGATDGGGHLPNGPAAEEVQPEPQDHLLLAHRPGRHRLLRCQQDLPRPPRVVAARRQRQRRRAQGLHPPERPAPHRLDQHRRGGLVGFGAAGGCRRRPAHRRGAR